MAKQQKLTYSFYVAGVQVDRLTPEQLDRMAARLSKSMSEYYTRHPDEYLKLNFKEK